MKNTAKKAQCEAPQESLEIIELAVSNVEALSRAFNLISEICEYRDSSSISLESSSEESLLH